jgi:hypothetical protein
LYVTEADSGGTSEGSASFNRHRSLIAMTNPERITMQRPERVTASVVGESQKKRDII